MRQPLRSRSSRLVLGVRCQEERPRSSLGRLGQIAIEAPAVQEYLALVGKRELDARRFTVIDDLPLTDPASFVELENEHFVAEPGRRTRV